MFHMPKEQYYVTKEEFENRLSSLEKSLDPKIDSHISSGFSRNNPLDELNKKYAESILRIKRLELICFLLFVLIVVLYIKVFLQ